MAIAYGARAGSTSGTTVSQSSFAVTTTASIAAGNTIVVSVGATNVGDLSNVKTVTDSAGNTYTSAGFTVDGGQNTLCAVWYCANCLALASSSTVTVTLNVAMLTFGTFWSASVDYLTGAATTTPTDGEQGKNLQTGATWNTGTGITTTNAADLLWVAFCTNQGWPAALTNAASTPNTGWTTLATLSGSGNGAGAAYNIVAATGTYLGGGTATATNNGTSDLIVAFKAASGGGSTPLTASPVLAKAVTTTAVLSTSVPLTSSPTLSVAVTPANALLSTSVPLASSPTVALATTAPNAILSTSVPLGSSPVLATAATTAATLSTAVPLTTSPVLAVAIAPNTTINPGGGALAALPAVARAITTTATLTIAVALSSSPTLATAVTQPVSLLVAVQLAAQAALAVAVTQNALLGGASFPGSVTLADALAHMLIMSDVLAHSVAITDTAAALVTIGDSPGEVGSA